MAGGPPLRAGIRKHDAARRRWRIPALVSALLVGAQVAAAVDPCVLRIGTSTDYPPFSQATDDGTFRGLDIDVAERLGADLGCEVRFVPFQWTELLGRVAAGDFDLAMSGITMRWERALVGRYTRPYAFTGAVAVVAASASAALATVDDLNRPPLRIAVNRGGHLERVARARFPRATLHTVADNRALPNELEEGSADAVITDSAEVQTWQMKDIRVIGPFTRDAKAFLLPAGAAERAQQVDEWLVAREVDGWLPQARIRWLGAGRGLDAAQVARNAIAALVQLRLTLMPAVAAAKRAADLPLTDAAQEARVLARVRGLAARAPDRIATVYGELIEMAKVVQRKAATPDASAALSAVRDAIARVDEQLVREIDRAAPSSTEQWLEPLTTFLTTPGVEPPMRTRLAQALAGTLPTAIPTAAETAPTPPPSGP